MLNKSKIININSNTIKNAKGDFASSGIFVNSRIDDVIHDDITIDGNIFDLNNTNAKNDIDIRNSTNVIISKNTTKLKTLVNGKSYTSSNSSLFTYTKP